MYESLSPEQSLSQGDIVDDCPVTLLDMSPNAEAEAASFVAFRARVIVMSQACDLMHQTSGKVVVALVRTCEEVVRQNLIKASAIRDHVRTHRMSGWYFLPTAPAPITLPESIVDMRELHTVPRVCLDRLRTDGHRVCRVVTPWREHLAQHFAITYMRIGLPEPYETEA